MLTVLTGFLGDQSQYPVYEDIYSGLRLDTNQAWLRATSGRCESDGVFGSLH